MGLKITLIEPHLEGAQFGPKSLNGRDQESAEEDNRASTESGLNLRRVIGVIAVSSLLMAGHRIIRLRNDNSSDEAGSYPTPRIKQTVESALE